MTFNLHLRYDVQTESGVYYDDDICGKLIETWVYHEPASLADLDDGYEIFQYRDSDKREIGL